MWICSCDKKGKFSQDDVVMRLTQVDKDDVCVRCGFYAVWDKTFTPHGDTLNKVCTIFTVGVSKPFKKCTVGEMLEFFDKKHSNLCKRVKLKKPYKPKDTDKVVYFEDLDELPDTGKSDTVVYAFDTEGNLVTKSESLSKISKVTKDKRNIILNNLSRGSIKTANGIVYSRNENFNVPLYLKTVEQGGEFSLDYNWRDTLAYDQKELGIEVVEDYYGTWKEKLYS